MSFYVRDLNGYEPINYRLQIGFIRYQGTGYIFPASAPAERVLHHLVSVVKFLDLEGISMVERISTIAASLICRILSLSSPRRLTSHNKLS